MSALLQARGVAHAYARTQVLDRVDFELAPGKLVIVVGPNGSGKTTLVRILAGILRPREGDVSIDGIAIDKLARRQIAQRLAVVPQESFVPCPYTVDEMVSMGRAPSLGALGREGPADRERVARALAELELAELSERDYSTLSGGEKQRVLLARARAQDADAMLLDEPTAHMDLGHRMHCFEWLRAWVGAGPQRRGAAVITHDLLLAARHADELVLLDQGRIVAAGEPDAVLTPQRIADVYGVDARVDRDPEGRLSVTPIATREKKPSA